MLIAGGAFCVVPHSLTSGICNWNSMETRWWPCMSACYGWFFDPSFINEHRAGRFAMLGLNIQNFYFEFRIRFHCVVVLGKLFDLCEKRCCLVNVWLMNDKISSWPGDLSLSTGLKLRMEAGAATVLDLCVCWNRTWIVGWCVCWNCLWIVCRPHGEAGTPKRQRIQKGQPQWLMWNDLSTLFWLRIHFVLTKDCLALRIDFDFFVIFIVVFCRIA